MRRLATTILSAACAATSAFGQVSSTWVYDSTLEFRLECTVIMTGMTPGERLTLLTSSPSNGIWWVNLDFFARPLSPFINLHGFDASLRHFGPRPFDPYGDIASASTQWPVHENLDLLGMRALHTGPYGENLWDTYDFRMTYAGDGMTDVYDFTLTGAHVPSPGGLALAALGAILATPRRTRLAEGR